MDFREYFRKNTTQPVLPWLCSWKVYCDQCADTYRERQDFNNGYPRLFPSIKEEQVREVFQSAGYSFSAAERLTEICCFQGKLPQGAPSSPYLANLFCRKMDGELGEIARKYELIYTRYADDMTFSGDKDLEFLIPLVEDTLQKYGFSANKEKTRIGKNHKMVTGLFPEENTLKVPKYLKRRIK